MAGVRRPSRCSPGPDNTAAAVDDDADAHFTAWCAAVGVRAPGVCLGRTATQFGRCAVAARRLRGGSLVASVPDAAVLTVAAARLGPALEAAGLGHGNGPWREGVGLALALLGEQAAGPASAWHGYAAWLGRADVSTHPALWRPADAARLLAGTATLARLCGTRCRHGVAGAARAWAVARAFARRHPAAFGGASQRALRSDFVRALVVVAAYAFTLGDDRILGLVPWWDVLNHDDKSRNSAGHVRLSHSPHTGRLAMHIARGVNLAPGDEVLNSYGRLGGGELLRRYGIVSSLAEPVACGPFELGAAAVAAGLAPRPGLAARRAAFAARGRKLVGLIRPARALVDAAAAAALAGGQAATCGKAATPRSAEAAAAAVLKVVCDRRRRLLRAGRRRAKASTGPSGGNGDRRVAAAAAARAAEEAGVAALAAWAAAHSVV